MFSYIPGHLRFAFLSQSDHRGGRIYKCNVFNPYMAITRHGSDATLEVTRKYSLLLTKHQYHTVLLNSKLHPISLYNIT